MLELLWMVLMVFVGAQAAPSVNNLATVDELMEKLSVEPADTPVFLIQIKVVKFGPNAILDDTIDTAISYSGSDNSVYILRLFETPKTTTTTTTTTTTARSTNRDEGQRHPHDQDYNTHYKQHCHGRRGKRQPSSNIMEIDDVEDLRGQMTEIHQLKSLYVVIIEAGDKEAHPLMKSLRDQVWHQTPFRIIYVSRFAASGILRPISRRVSVGRRSVTDSTRGKRLRRTFDLDCLKDIGHHVWHSVHTGVERGKDDINTFVEDVKDTGRSKIGYIKNGLKEVKKFGINSVKRLFNIF